MHYHCLLRWANKIVSDDKYLRLNNKNAIAMTAWQRLKEHLERFQSSRQELNQRSPERWSDTSTSDLQEFLATSEIVGFFPTGRCRAGIFEAAEGVGVGITSPLGGVGPYLLNARWRIVSRTTGLHELEFLTNLTFNNPSRRLNRRA